MKKIVFMMLCALAWTGAKAQFNVQLHYDFGDYMNDYTGGRQKVTSTIEFFKADNLGNSFLFVDFDYRKDGVAAAYMEASREFTFKQLSENSSLAAHIEYDGGLCNVASYQQAALLGAAWNWHSNDFSKTFSLQAMYKHNFNPGAFEGVQLTGVWGLTFGKGKYTFSGFADLWTDNAKESGLVFFTEPQLWYNVNSNFSIGTEWEVTSGFYDNDIAPYVNPTLAVKYTF